MKSTKHSTSIQLEISALTPRIVLTIFIAFTSFSFETLQAQTEEERPINMEDVMNEELLEWEQYFEENFFSQGVPLSEMGEGTGYLPYARARFFYEARMDHQGKVPGMKRWEAFKKSRAVSMGRGGESMVANWQSIGPNTMESFGGRMITHAFDPTDSEVVWAGSASGGLWKTEDGGENWVSKSDQIPSTGVGAIAVNPQNSNSLLMGTGEGYFISVVIRPGLGVFKSTDGGQTWAETSLNFPQSQGISAFKLVWDTADTMKVYLAATNGVWVSEDAGENWSISLAVGIADDLIQDPTNPLVLYAAIESNGIYKSTDGGDSWNILNNGLPAGNTINFIHMAICDSLPNILFASIARASDFGTDGIYKTTDSGATWEKLTGTPDAFCAPAWVGFNVCQGHYDNAIAVAPNDPDRILFGGITFWLTEDGGQTWSQKDRYTCPNCVFPPSGKTWVDQHDIGFSPHDPNVVYVFNDGGVAKSIDSGNFWHLKNNGLLTAQFLAIASARTDTNVIIGGMQDHGLQATDLSNYQNNQWKVWGFLDGTDVEVNYQDEDIFYGVWADGQYMKTTTGITPYDTYTINNGIDATENIFYYFNPLRIHPVDPNILYTATSLRIYRTISGGALWVPVANIPNVKVLEIDQTNPDIVYAASYSNQGTWAFWRTENAGEDWFLTDSYPGWRVTDIKSDPNNAGVLFATRNSAFAGSPHIYKSTNYGDTWQAISNNLPDITVNAMTINTFDSECLYVATDLGVYMSSNGGNDWQEYNHGMPISFAMDIHYHPGDTTLRIGTLGRGAWKTKSYPLNYPTEVGTISQAISISAAYPFPSPSNSQVSLNYELRHAAKINIKIYNNLGQTVCTLVNEEQTAGEQQVTWNLNTAVGTKATTGVYYFWLAADDRAVVRKFVVQ